MWKSRFAAAVFSSLFALGPSIARADCVEDARLVNLDAQNVVRLKGYLCREGETQIKVEFHRFAETAASLVVAKRSTALLKKTLGSPKLIENDVFKSYAEILQKFGATIQAPGGPGDANYKIGTEGQEDQLFVGDRLPGSTVRKVLGWQGSGTDHYPAADEIAALRKKTIPDGVGFIYSATCLEKGEPVVADTDCKEYDPSTVEMTFWRPMRRDDLGNYAKNIKAYNRTLSQFKSELRARGQRKTLTDDPLRETDLSQKLKLYKFFAGDGWPDDFVLLFGDVGQGCGDDTIRGIDGWEFRHSGRDIFLDTVSIENTSTRPLNIAGLLGSRMSQPRLRRADTDTPGSSASDLVINMGENLAPGQKLLIPLRIVLAPDEWTKMHFERPKVSKSIFERLGANGFSGKLSAHGNPKLPDYAFGPEYSVAGFQVGGTRVELRRRAANFIDVTVGAEIGSCPYLLSWNERHREWIDHGKVLHKAPSNEREYTETRIATGFTSRLRIEEREPEVAFIDHVEVEIALRTGETLTLKPDNPSLVERDGDYLRLYWGDAIEIQFALPAAIAEEDVTESRLTVSGYYLRYSDLKARDQAEQRTSPGPSRWTAPIASIAPAAPATDPVCMAPGQLRATLLKPR
jgi:hypothetical protein